MVDTYNGYTNWETWTTMMVFDEELYEVAKGYKKEGMTFEKFVDRVEDIIRDDCDYSLRYPDNWSLAGEFVRHCLGTVNFKEIAELVWEEVSKDQE